MPLSMRISLAAFQTVPLYCTSVAHRRLIAHQWNIGQGQERRINYTNVLAGSYISNFCTTFVNLLGMCVQVRQFVAMAAE